MHTPPAPSPSPAPASPVAAAPQPPRRTSAPWVPIRTLSADHRPQIAAHLLALDERDRYLRFGYPASDGHIARYVEGLDTVRDELFGIFDRRLQLIAFAHLAYPGPGLTGRPVAEFGGSVLKSARGRGWGARLFEQAMLQARNRGFDHLFIHALSENTAMLRIARRAGGTIQRWGGESDALVRLPRETLASRLEQWVGEGAARLDYHFKRRQRR